MMDIVLGTLLFTLIVVILGIVVMAARAALLPVRKVAVSINGDRSLPAWTGDKLLGALNDAGINIPSACAGAGTCGLCKVVVTDGAGDPLPTERARLSRADIREGTRLACQVTVREPIAVELPPALLDVEAFTCGVESIRSLSPLIREIVLELPQGQKFDFRAGAFVQVTAPAYRLNYADIELSDDIRAEWRRLGIDRLAARNDAPLARAYSVANTPADAGKIVLLIRLAAPPPATPDVPPGIVSSYLFGLKKGDSVEVSGPYGDFGATDTDREMVFIGGGVGMAPLRAIIHDQLERVGTSRNMSFWYGARSRGDLFYVEEFDALAEAHENFSWTSVLSDPAPNDDWDGAIGFVHAVAFERYLKDHPAPESCEYYLCGPPLMIQAVLAMLEDCGVEPGSIFNDDFGG